MSLVHTSWKGHSVLITGASSGIGESLARDLTHAGVKHLTLVARRRDRLEALSLDLKKVAPELSIQVISHDLGSPGAGHRLFEIIQSQSEFPPITVLVNNAGIGPYAPFVETEQQRHATTIDLNIHSLVELAHCFSREFLKRDIPSHIINIASIAGYQPVPGYAVYAGTKHFVRVFSRTLHYELRHTPVRVTCVCPGGTRTEFLDRAGQNLKKEGESFVMSAAEVSRQILQGVERGRPLIIPGLLNQLICFLPRLLPESLGLFFAEKSMNRAVDRKKPELT